MPRYTDSQIRQAVADAGGNITDAAQKLGYRRDTVRRRLQKAVPMESGQIDDPLWRAFVASPSTELRRRLFDQHRPEVDQILSCYFSTLPPTVDHDALRQEGYIAAYKAIDTFEPTRGLKFATHIYRRVRGAAGDLLRKLDTASRRERQLESRRKQAISDIFARLGVLPGETQVRDHLGWDAKTYQSSRPAKNVYLDHCLIQETPAEPRGRHDAELMDHLTRGLEIEPRIALYLYYAKGHTMRRIGEVLLMSESSVSQMMAKALGWLRGARDRTEAFADTRGGRA